MSSKSLKAPKLAFGNAQLILHSVCHYWKKHNGKLPERIEVSTLFKQKFLNELQCDYPCYLQDYTDDGRFLSIPIITGEFLDQPRLVTHDGKVEYL